MQTSAGYFVPRPKFACTRPERPLTGGVGQHPGFVRIEVAGEHAARLACCRSVLDSGSRLLRRWRAPPPLHDMSRYFELAMFPICSPASARVARLIASAVAADPRWFWHGPGV